MIAHSPACDLEIQDCHDLLLAHFRGPRIILDELNAQEVGRRLRALTPYLTGRTFVLSLAEVAYLTSTSLGILVGLHKRLQASGGRLILCELVPEVEKLFRLTHLHTVLDIRRRCAGAA